MKRSPAAAVWLSLIPGAGHIYAGDVAKGILLVLLVGSTIQIVSHGAEGFGILIPFLWLYAMIDAHRTAVEANRRIASGGSARGPGVGIANWWGYVLIVLGVLFAAENLDLFEFEWIWRLWPLGLVALGVWILRRKEPESPPAESLPPLPGDEPGEPASAAEGENG